ncbi:MAG: hypothetical protein EBU66_17020 [Bacteroidetes bacterium]|nr:hypothetical protein [Bacteroidota bacterium]
MALLAEPGEERLYELMKEVMNDDEQHLFIESFKAYLKYGNDETAFVINLDDVWEWMGFVRKDPAKCLFVKHFTENIHYTILLHRSVEQDNKHGGNNKETIMMTVNTFKKFFMKASTKRADQICDYYLKMENVMHKFTHEKLVETNNALIKSDKFIECERSRILAKAHSKKRILYTIKLLCDCEEKEGFYVKIGISKDIESRVHKIKDFFKCEVVIIDIFPCDNNESLERFLFNNEKIVKLKYDKIINNANKSTEVIMVKSMNEYNTVKRLIELNMYQFNSKTFEEKKIELGLKYADIFKDDKDGLLKALDMVSNIKVLSPTKQEEATIIKQPIVVKEQQQIKETTKFYGPKVQLYDGNNTSQLVNVFNSITEATRKIQKSSFTHIKIAARNNLLYLGYRWFLIDRDDPNPNEVKDIGETKISGKRIVDFVAMLNLEKTEIIKVFKLQKEAASFVEQCVSALCNAIKYNTPLSGHYWVFWNELDEELKSVYTQKQNLPDNIIKPKAHQVFKIDPITNKVLETYPSITDAAKIMHLSPKTLKLVAKTNEIYKEFKWQILSQ